DTGELIHRHHVGAHAPLDLTETAVVGLLEGLEGPHEVIETGAKVRMGRSLHLETFVIQHRCQYPHMVMGCLRSRAASAICRSSRASHAEARPASRRGLRPLRPSRITARASERVNPASC